MLFVMAIGYFNERGEGHFHVAHVPSELCHFMVSYDSTSQTMTSSTNGGLRGGGTYAWVSRP